MLPLFCVSPSALREQLLHQLDSHLRRPHDGFAPSPGDCAGGDAFCIVALACVHVCAAAITHSASRLPSITGLADTAALNVSPSCAFRLPRERRSGGVP